MQVKRTERNRISRSKKGFVAMGNFTKKSKHHVKVLPVLQVPMFLFLTFYCFLFQQKKTL